MAPTPGRCRSRIDNTMVKALAHAYRWKKLLDAGVYPTVHDLAAAEKINPFYIARILRLSLLAPDIVEAILDGRQPAGLQLDALLTPFPVEWERQRARQQRWSRFVAERGIAVKKYVVRLSADEREALAEFIRSGKRSARI
jgi:hypothetical protein